MFIDTTGRSYAIDPTTLPRPRVGGRAIGNSRCRRGRNRVEHMLMGAIIRNC
ncbi:hypothetical protein KCP73_16385 [Salmonella enterica subsp. enterica]|nr:hypothetical protein KCP73_16385 [Salmonella enterica subsp. enterica]